MRFDQWLLKHKDRRYGIGFISHDFIKTGHNPLFKYHHCELFIKCYNYSLYLYKKKYTAVPFEKWLLSQATVFGKEGNLSREVIEGMYPFKEKLSYCRKYVRHFKTCERNYTGYRHSHLERLNIPLNLDSPIEGVKRVSLHLIEHPCFSGFDIFPELKRFPQFKDCVFQSR